MKTTSPWQAMVARLEEMPEGGFKEAFFQYVLARAVEEEVWKREYAEGDAESAGDS